MQGFGAIYGGGIKDGGSSTVDFVKSLGTTQGWKNVGNGILDLADRANAMSPTGMMKNAQTGVAVSNYVSNIPNMTKDQIGHDLGYGLEKTVEAVALSKGAGAITNAVKGAGAASGIANAIPGQVARVIPNFGGEVTTLGRAGATDVFVTASSDIKGLNAAQIAQKLTIPESSTGFKVITFETPQGIASPINRTNPGFIGRGRTAGGAREFVVPNQPIPSNAKIKIVN